MSALAAGAVNGTAAEPGPGTRVVVDTDGDGLSIAGGVATFANPNDSWGDPVLQYNAVTRAAGRLMLMDITPSLTNKRIKAGFSDSQAGNPLDVPIFLLHTDAKIYLDGTTANNNDIGSYAASQQRLALVLKATGAYYFRKDTYWELLYISPIDATATLYPVMHEHGQAFTADYIRIPDVLWLPTPTCFDSFDRANGAIGTSETSGPDSQAVTARTWTGAGFTVASNVAVGTPTQGAEELVNGDMETGDPPNGWGTVGATLAADADAHGGLQSLSVTRAAGNYALKDSANIGNGTWFAWSGWRKGDSCYFAIQSTAGYIPTADAYSVEAAYAQRLITGRAGSALDVRTVCYVENVAETGLFDDVSVKQLTLATLFASIDDAATADVVASVNVVLTAGTQAGLVVNLDDATAPANFVICYHDGVNAKLEKCVAGTYTSVISAAATYSASATIRVVKDGTSYSLYYNNAKIGSTSTISDAGIISNTKHGLFSTYASNTLDNFELFPRGDGAYSDLEKW